MTEIIIFIAFAFLLGWVIHLQFEIQSLRSMLNRAWEDVTDIYKKTEHLHSMIPWNLPRPKRRPPTPSLDELLTESNSSYLYKKILENEGIDVDQWVRDNAGKLRKP